MVGIFSRFAVRGSHRRTQSALEERLEMPPMSEATATNILPAAASAVTTHGIDILIEFKPVEHPTEPLDSDQPILCPLPEPSILNDGRIWKERVSSVGHTRTEAPRSPESETKPNRRILPSVSAPEHNILQLLQECNASGISFNT